MNLIKIGVGIIMSTWVWGVDSSVRASEPDPYFLIGTKVKEAPVLVGEASASSNNSSGGEMAGAAFDHNYSSKWCVSDSAAWLQFKFATGTERAVTAYAVTSANDVPGRDPMDWQFQGSNDGQTWVTLDTETSQNFASRYQTNSYPVVNETVYAYYRLNVTANRGGSSYGLQLSEVALLSSAPGEANSTAAGIASASNNNSGDGEKAVAAFDQDANTKWCIGDSTGWLQYQFTSGAEWTVSHYEITSANDVPERDPMDWQFQGSNDGQNWKVLDEQSGQTFTDRHQTNSYNISNTTAYAYYRLAVSANNGGSSQGLQLADLALFSSAPPVKSCGKNGSIRSSFNNEGLEAAFDGDIYTKWCIPPRAAWLRYQFGHGAAWAVNQYQISSANDVPERDPMDWQFQGSTDGQNWVTLDTQTGQTFANRYQTNSYSISNATPYPYYRLNVTANSGGSSYGLQFSELTMFSPAPPTDSATSGFASDSVNNSIFNGGPAFAFDQDLNTKWCVPNCAAWLQYRLSPGEAWAVDRYEITSANDVPERDPMDWAFQGSNDGDHWTTLDLQSGQEFAGRYQTKGYSVANPAPYAYYRLNVMANHGGSAFGLQLAELAFFSSVAPVVTDSDSDGIPDDWELQNGLDPHDPSDAALDSDHDGLTNAQEYQIGSNPWGANPGTENLPLDRNVAGKVLWERWSGPAFASTWMEDIRRVGSYPASPNESNLTDTFEITPNQAVYDSGNRLRAYVVPKVTGAYRFFVTGEGQAVLSVSTTGKTYDRHEICSAGYVAPNDWQNGSAPLYLQKGFRYYLELVTRQPYTWGTKLKSRAQVGWTTPEQNNPSLIPSEYLVSMGAEDDADDDGLPDDWEQAHFGNLLQSGMGDPDHDGLTNSQEYQLGTDPNSPDSNTNGVTDAGEASGFLTYDYWFNLPGTSVEDFLASPRYNQSPDGRLAANSANEVSPLSLNSATVLRGYLVPQSSGNYQFINTAGNWNFPAISETDWTAVYLSPDADPAHKQRLLGLNGATATRALVAGQRYYLEIVHKIGTSPTSPQRLLWQSDQQPWYSDLPADVLRPLDELGVPAPAPLPESWLRADIGVNHRWLAYPSVSTFHSDGSLQIQATGVPLDRHADGLHFVYKELSGNGEIRARLTDLDTTYTGTTAGVMIRKGMNAGDLWAGLRLDGNHQLIFSARTIPNGIGLGTDGLDHAGPTWLRLVRRAGWVYAYTSPDGARWIACGQQNLGFSGPVSVGLFSTSNSETQYGQADFEDIYCGPELSGAVGSNVVPDSTADQDHDGYSDAEEIDELHSDPTVADLEPAQTVALVAGNEATSTIGTWGFQGDTIYNDSVRGSIRFRVNVPTDGIYRLAIQGSPRRNLTADATWFVIPSVDGQSLGRLHFDLQMGETGTIYAYTPWLKAGQHFVEIYLDNVSIDRSFGFQSLALQRIDGVDANENGIPDWMEARLAAENTFSTTPVESRTSPYCLEGSTRYRATLTLTADDQALPILAGIGRGWHTEVALDADEETEVTASSENGAVVQNRTIHWASTDVRLGETLKIRKGDALLLLAGAQAEIAFTKDGEAQDVLTTDPDGKVVHQFAAPGHYTLTAPDQSEVGPLKVEVVESQFSKPDPLIALGYVRDWLNPSLTLDSVVQTDSRMDVQEVLAPNTGGREFRLRLDAAEPRMMLARLNDGTTIGPILDSAELKGLQISSGIDTGILVVTRFPDGSKLVEMSVVLNNLPSDVRIKFEIFAAGVTFEDGSTVKWFTAADFDAQGMIKVRFLMAPGVETSVCHRIFIYQGDTLLETRVN